MTEISSRSALFAAAALWLALAACTPEAPYFGPKDGDHSTGYTDEKLDQNRYRVTYSGNSATPRETVENFLLLRSAQVTQQTGANYFMFDMRDTKAKTTYLSDFPVWAGDPFYHGPRYGWYWHGWPGYDDETEARPITRFQAYAEIIVLTDAQAAKEPRAIGAQSIIQHLTPAPAH